jgi:hypothetical protein
MNWGLATISSNCIRPPLAAFAASD